MRIFVIDDEEAIRETFRIHLEDEGHEALVAASPVHCAVYNGHDCRNDFPCAHAVFIDFFLPDMNAFDFLEMMDRRGCRGMMRNKIVMTGDATAVDPGRAERLGCQVLQKPVRLADIDRIIKHIASRVDPDERLARLP